MLNHIKSNRREVKTLKKYININKEKCVIWKMKLKSWRINILIIINYKKPGRMTIVEHSHLWEVINRRDRYKYRCVKWEIGLSRKQLVKVNKIRFFQGVLQLNHRELVNLSFIVKKNQWIWQGLSLRIKLRNWRQGRDWRRVREDK